MNKKLLKLLSAIIVSAVIIGTINVNIFAEELSEVVQNLENDENNSESENSIVYMNNDDGTYTGKCGSNTEWKLTSNDWVLTISGTGAIEASPWKKYSQNIKKIIIEDGITEICDSAFSNCHNVQGQINIPDSVTKIGASAFFGCRSLTGSLTIPTGVTEIGQHAFHGCSGLNETLTIPASVTAIYEDAFKTCSSLRKVVNNSNISIPLPHISNGIWLNESDPQNEISSIVNGVAVVNCRVVFRIGNVVYDEKAVITGNTITKPTDPSKDGFIFLGWTDDLNSRRIWDFNSPVNYGMDLYAVFDGDPQYAYGINCADGYFEFTRVQYEFLQGFWAYTGDWQASAKKHTKSELISICQVEGHIYDDISTTSFNVKFGYFDENGVFITLKDETVNRYSDATPPAGVPSVYGREHIGWKGSYKDVTSNRIVYALFDGYVDNEYFIQCSDGNYEFSKEEYEFLQGFWAYTGDWQASAKKHTRSELISICQVEGHIYEGVSKVYYRVKFGYYDSNGVFKLLKEELVEKHKDATPPAYVPDIDGKEHTGWNGVYTDITSSRIIYASLNTKSSATATTSGGPTIVIEKYNPVNTTTVIKANDAKSPDISKLSSDKPDESKKTDSRTGSEKQSTVDEQNTANSELVVNDSKDKSLQESKEITIDGSDKADVVKTISEATEGSKITVDMSSGTVVDKAILAEAQGKNVDLVLDMGGYSWTINGMDITGKYLDDINLEVKFEQANIPQDMISELAGDKAVKTLSLTHDGAFGFKAKLKFNLGSDNQGMYANLYYWNEEDNTLEIQYSGIIDGNGDTELVFEHASEYAVILSEYKMQMKLIGAAAVETSTPYDIVWLSIIALGVICTIIVCTVAFIRLREKKDTGMRF